MSGSPSRIRSHTVSNSPKDNRRSGNKASTHRANYAAGLPALSKKRIEIWRREQRAADPRNDSFHLAHATTPINLERSSSSEHTSKSLLPKNHRFEFPSTAEAFNLPNSNQVRPAARFTNIYTQQHNHELDMETTRTDVEQLRNDAFLELRRSVEESGEGFVRKMREWELRGRKRPQSMISRRRTGSVGEEEVGDCRWPDQAVNHPPLKKRALSVDVMDVEPNTPSHDSPPSPVTQWNRIPSLSASDDENDIGASLSDNMSSMPSMTTDPSSSPISPSFAMDEGFHLPAATIPITPAEKAIAALTLALQNGAGGLSDYHALLGIAEVPVLDVSEVGDMWN